jgi:hypothetical protein
MQHGLKGSMEGIMTKRNIFTRIPLFRTTPPEALSRRKMPILSAVLTALFFSSVAFAQTEDYTTWSSHKKIYLNTTASGAGVNGTVTNFPVLVRLNPSNFSGFGSTQPLGADIRFSGSNYASHLPFEIERWVDVAGNGDTAEIWVNVSSIAGNNSAQYIVMHYGNSTATAQSNGKSVFDTANGYRAVWHLKDTADATLRQNGLTRSAPNNPATLPGIIGRAMYLDSINSLDAGQRTSLAGTTNFSISTWVKTTPNRSYAFLAAQQSQTSTGDYGLAIDSGGPCDFWTWNSQGYGPDVYSTKKVDDGNWHLVAGVRNGNNAYVFIDGSQDGSGSATAVNLDNTSHTSIGSSPAFTGQFHYKGYLDEMQISTVARSADWIKLSYETQRLVGSSVCIPPGIATQPQPVTVTVGSNAAFSVSAPAGISPVNYLWQRVASGGTTWTAVAGATNSSYTFQTAIADTNAHFRCIVYTCACAADTSQSALLTVRVPPSNLTYSTNPASYVAGTAITANNPSSSGGAVVSYSVAPALPSGLALNAATGVITGTPTTVAGAVNYVVTATNAVGSTTASLLITITSALLPPSNLAYSTNPATYVTGTAIAANNPSSSGGAVASYSVAPALPAGLALTTTSGVVTGTPTTAKAAANYIVTATNAAGSTTVALLITVNAALLPPSNLAYSTNPATYVTGAAITANNPSSSGGAVASYSVSPALPAGLALSTTTGVITGTPTTAKAAANYVVSATNAAGSTTATLLITVTTAIDSNKVVIAHPVFDTSKNQIRVAWTVSVGSGDSVGISYSTAGYPSVAPAGIQVVPVRSGSDSAVVQFHENIVFKAVYYIALWERRAGGTWIAPTARSEDTVTAPNYTWQSVTYFTKMPGDTAFAFNNNIRLMTDPVLDSNSVVRITDKVVFWQPSFAQLSGFEQASIAFRFAQPQSSAPIYVGLRYVALPGTYSVNDLRMYRFQDSVWVVEGNAAVDPASGYVTVKTNNLGSVFMVMLDTMPVTVRRGSHRDTVPDQSDLYDTFTISDNCANVKWQFMSSKGGDAYSAGIKSADSLGYTRGGRAVVHIPYWLVTQENGVRAVFEATDGVHTTRVDASRQVRRSNSDFVRTEPLKWEPLRVTAILDSPQVRYALRDTNDASKPWTYDTKNVRLFKWYPNAQNAKQNEKWVEYSDAAAAVFNFQCGGLIWIKTREQTDVNFGAGVTVPLATSQSIVMEPGTWTDMALPYKFDIRIGDIIDSTLAGTLNAESLQIYSWVRDAAGVFRTQPVYIADLAVANLANKATVLGCLDLTGYTIYNPMPVEQIVLRVPPIPQSMSHYGQKLPKPKAEAAPGWAIRVRSGLQNGSTLSDVYCVYDPSKGGATRFYPLPPTFEKAYTGVYDGEKKKVFGHALTGVVNGDGWAFRIAFVNESEAGQKFVYTLEPTGAVPDPFEVKIFNETTGLYDDAPVSVAPGETRYRWLFAGTDRYLARAPMLNAPPLRLTGTYPNPFWGMVRIRYSVPSSGIESLKFTICDFRGRIVWRQTVGCKGRVGAQELAWNAEVLNGHGAVTGIYLLKMSALDGKGNPSGVFERKMTLLR